MAYRRFQQDLRPFDTRPLNKLLLVGFCLLGILLIAPPDGFSQPPAAQSSKKPSPRELLARAQAFQAQKQYDRAASAYREYLAIRPKDENVKAALARLLTLQGSHEEAAGLYASLASRHPENIDYQLGLARIKSLQTKFAEAQTLYERVLSKAPGNLEATRGLADALAGNGQSALALPHYERLYAATKDSAVAEQISKVKAEMEKMSSVPATPPETAMAAPLSPQQILERARALAAARQYQEAVSAYRAYLEAKPEDDDVHRSLAQLFLSQGQYREAISVYQTILSRHPSDIEALITLGKIAVQQKRISDGHRYYEAALSTDPSNIEAKQGLADLLYWRKEYATALRFYEDVFSATQNPVVGRRIQEIRHQQIVSPQAPIGITGDRPILPFRNYIKFGYSHYAYTQQVPNERDALLEVAKSLGEQTLVGRMEILNRFGFDDVPVTAKVYSPLWKKAWGDLSFSAAANPNFVPNFRLGGQLFQDLGLLHEALSFLEASLGLERLSYSYRARTSQTLFIPAQDITVVTPSLAVYLPFNMWVTEKVYYIPDTGSITLSSQLTWRPTERVQLYASGAFGTSGERIVAFQDFTRADTRSFQGGAIFPLTKELSGELSGFYEDRESLYVRRGGTFNLIWHW